MNSKSTNAASGEEKLGISAEVAQLLRECGMHPEPTYTDCTDLLLVRDERGDGMFQMTPAISVTDLRHMLGYAWSMYQRGVRDGNDEAQRRMRAALGLDATTPPK